MKCDFLSLPKGREASLPASFFAQKTANWTSIPCWTRNYVLVYTAPLTSPDSTLEQLGKLYKQFNPQKSIDFHSPSMSVSNIVAIRQGNRLSYYYCDHFGFEQIPGFLPGNSLKNSEMLVEDDYGMIDGIINNTPREPQKQEKKRSVREQLQAKPRTKQKRQCAKRARKGRFDMQDFSFDEANLMCIYNGGKRELLIQVLTEMRGHLSPEETELRELTDKTLAKLQAMTDEEFAKLEPHPDFDE